LLDYARDPHYTAIADYIQAAARQGIHFIGPEGPVEVPTSRRVGVEAEVDGRPEISMTVCLATAPGICVAKGNGEVTCESTPLLNRFHVRSIEDIGWRIVEIVNEGKGSC
jgi:hypothetical protein